MLTIHAPIDLVMAETQCWNCKASTPVSSLRAHAVTGPEGNSVEGVRITNAADLPADLKQAIHAVNPNFRKGFSRTAEQTYFANHCSHCGALQGDFYMYMEPDGPFFAGTVPEGATTTRLFEAGDWQAEAGYGS
ncbi:hypothetical protein [Hydrogenophaga sp.]|uniref:hypothetical protein n=1 Tax=Hydrogenophaga sp. TaxID=1904254 RepID=UPI002723BA98|nr:hypothetical protein [Hydrogenophaga sp.]MDO8903226.1 hypothetical protein [Hydrogenophaga sp.]